MDPEIFPDAFPEVSPEATDAAPPVLAELIAAGLVSHEMIGDPARLGGEANGLRALCALVAGPVYRIEAYHYAFRAGPGDLDGRLAGLAPGEWTGALETALAATLGAEAVWLNPTDLLPEAAAALAPPLLLLRAQDAAVAGALESVGPGLQAVINARYAADCARITLERLAAAEADGPLAARLAVIEARQAEILARLEREPEAAPAGQLAETLTQVVARLEALEAALAHSQAASAERLAMLEAGQPGQGPIAFQETLGVTLAEFLARIEQRAETDRIGLRVPQFN